MGLSKLRKRLDETLFRRAPQTGPEPGERGALLVILVGILSLAVLLQLLRIGWSNALDSIWAEDGTIFLQAALNGGFLDTVFTPYANYLVLAPRLIAEGAAATPLGDAAAAISILSAATVALCGLLVWFASGGLVSSPYLRGALAASVVLAPVSGLEAVDSAAYAPWYMLFATFWVLLWRPRTAWAAGIAGGFVLLTALSSPGVWFFLPLAALRALAVRDGRDLAIVGGYGVGAAVQIPVFALNQAGADDPIWTSDIWTAYVQRAVDGAIFGQELGGLAWANLGWPFLAILLALAIAGLSVGAARSASPARWFVAIAIPTSLVVFVVSAYQRTVGSALVWEVGSYGGVSSRYAIVPALLVLSAALVLVDGIGGRRRLGGRLSVPGIVAICVVALAIATSFSVGDSSIRGEPRWHDALRTAAHACVTEGEETAGIATSPPGFGVQVPCERVSGFADAARPSAQTTTQQRP